MLHVGIYKSHRKCCEWNGEYNLCISSKYETAPWADFWGLEGGGHQQQQKKNLFQVVAASQYLKKLKQREQNSSAVLHNFVVATGQSVWNVPLCLESRPFQLQSPARDGHGEATRRWAATLGRAASNSPVLRGFCCGDGKSPMELCTWGLDQRCIECETS